VLKNNNLFDNVSFAEYTCTLQLQIVISDIFFQGVESERCASFKAAMDAGEPVYTPLRSTIADGNIIVLFV